MQSREKLGFAISGKSLTGKTKFVDDWLRRTRRHERLLVPRGPIPLPHPRLAAAGRCWILLNDLNKMDDAATSILQFIDRAQNMGAKVMVAATIRRGLEMTAVDDSPHAREILAKLDHWELLPPANEDCDKVALVLDEPRPTPGDMTFGWLADDSWGPFFQRFREMDLGAANSLRAAKTLEERGIPVTKARWQNVAEDVFQLDATPGAFDRAVVQIWERNFLQQETPDPGLLARVVTHVEAHLPHTLDGLLQRSLEQRDDAPGLGSWADHAYLRAKNIAASDALNAAAFAVAVRMGQYNVAARVAFNLGFLRRTTDPAKARQAYEDAITYGKKADNPEGWVQAAKAAFNLSVLLKPTDPAGARQAYEDAITYGKKADNPEGWVVAATAAFNLGVLLEKTDKQGAERAFDLAIEFGDAAKNLEGTECAGRSAFRVGRLIEEDDSAKAGVYYRKTCEALAHLIEAKSALAKALADHIQSETEGRLREWAERWCSPPEGGPEPAGP